MTTLDIAFLTVAAACILVGVFANKRAEDLLGEAANQRQNERRSLMALPLQVVVVAMAVAYILRTLGHARIGIDIAVPILIVNAIVARTIRLAIVRPVLDPDTRARYARWLTIEAASFAVGFAFVYGYLRF